MNGHKAKATLDHWIGEVLLSVLNLNLRTEEAKRIREFELGGEVGQKPRFLH